MFVERIVNNLSSFEFILILPFEQEEYDAQSVCLCVRSSQVRKSTEYLIETLEDRVFKTYCYAETTAQKTCQMPGGTTDRHSSRSRTNNDVWTIGRISTLFRSTETNILRKRLRIFSQCSRRLTLFSRMKQIKCLLARRKPKKMYMRVKTSDR